MLDGRKEPKQVTGLQMVEVLLARTAPAITVLVTFAVCVAIISICNLMSLKNCAQCDRLRHLRRQTGCASARERTSSSRATGGPDCMEPIHE